MNIFAFTENNPDQPSYPGFVSINKDDDGNVVVTVREQPTARDGSYICGFASDKGQPGRCTKGDDHCNNYCNMAPEKGPMADRPLPCQQVFEGRQVSIVVPAEHWSLS